jgi:hypothetical protein
MRIGLEGKMSETTHKCEVKTIEGDELHVSIDLSFIIDGAEKNDIHFFDYDEDTRVFTIRRNRAPRRFYCNPEFEEDDDD